MNYFIARVELHNVKPDNVDYTTLHEKMKDVGFDRTISSGGGVVRELPPAEYHLESEIDVKEARTKAVQAAKETGYEVWAEGTTAKKTCAVLVTKGHIAWTGLKPATPAKVDAAANAAQPGTKGGGGARRLI